MQCLKALAINIRKPHFLLGCKVLVFTLHLVVLSLQLHVGLDSMCA